MNDDKWLSTPSVARLVAHLAETGDRERVAVVLADLAAVAHPSTQDGDPSHARRAADTMASMLAIELDVAPADASALLAERLRRRIPKRP